MPLQINFHFNSGDADRVCFCPRPQIQSGAKASHNSLQFKFPIRVYKRKNRASITRSTVTITQPSGRKIRFSLLARSAYGAARALFRRKACQGISHRDQELPDSHGIYAWSCCGLPGRSRSDACG